MYDSEVVGAREELDGEEGWQPIRSAVKFESGRMIFDFLFCCATVQLLSLIPLLVLIQICLCLSNSVLPSFCRVDGANAQTANSKEVLVCRASFHYSLYLHIRNWAEVVEAQVCFL